MTPNFTLHTTNDQPPETRGKIVTCRLYNQEIYVRYFADLMNWKQTGQGSPTSGRIFEYQIHA